VFWFSSYTDSADKICFTKKR